MANPSHNFSGVLKAKGLFVYCNRCGLVKLNNRATEKQINKPCIGLRDLDDDEYLKLKGHNSVGTAMKGKK